jgi:CHRD domain
MQNKKLVALAAIGMAAAIAVPTIAFGNARNNVGFQHFDAIAETPLVGLMNGPADLTAVTPTGDADGTGTAAFTFDVVSTGTPGTGAEVCWDLSYSNLTGTPIAAHIHRGIAGVSGPIVVPDPAVAPSFPNLGVNSATGCMDMDGTLAQEILDTPSNFYINVHTTDFPAGAIRSQLSTGTAPAGEAHLLPSPLRAYDSRTLDGPLAPNVTRTISLASGKNGVQATVLAVPAGATGAIVTLTVTDTTVGVGGPGGFLTLYSNDLATPPSTSSINWTGAGQNLAVTTQVAIDALGRVKVTDGANATNFVLDVIGYTF